MSVLFANFISYLFNPVVVLLLVPLVLVYKTTNDLNSALIWTGYTVIYLLVMSFFILYGVKKKLFTDIDVSRREQRPLLFTVSILIAIVYLGGVLFFHGPSILFLITFGTIVGIFLASIINVFFKVSIHVATISAFLIAVAFSYRGFYYSLLLFIPLVAWSRIKTKRHTLSETIAGAMLGVVLSLFMYLLLKFFIT